MKKIAVLCPSRYRPEGLRKAYESWKAKSVASDIFFCFQNDDPDLLKNIEVIEHMPYLIVGNVGMVSKVNRLCGFFANYDAYLVLNDDQVIHTHGWDKMLLDEIDRLESQHGHRLWILSWRDGIQDGNLCQGFATKEMLEITGSYYPVGYMRHLYSDDYFMHIGKECNILRYLPDVYIEHLHFSVGKSPNDKSYAETNCAEAFNRDKEAFDLWKAEKSIGIISRIRGGYQWRQINVLYI